MKPPFIICSILLAGANTATSAGFFRSLRHKDNPIPIKLVQDGITAAKANQPIFSGTINSGGADPFALTTNPAHDSILSAGTESSNLFAKAKE